MCVCSLAFAPAALDEETDEIEERRVSVLPIRLNPVIDHRLLTRHKQDTLCVLSSFILRGHILGNDLGRTYYFDFQKNQTRPEYADITKPFGGH